MDDNVYIKKPNGRYEPIGLRHIDYIPDGIWLVHHNNGGTRTTSVKYIEGMSKIGEARPLDIPALCGKQLYCDYILGHPKFQEVIKGSYCINDIVHTIVDIVLEKNNSVVDESKPTKKEVNRSYELYPLNTGSHYDNYSKREGYLKGCVETRLSKK